jgi:hypothetical protein
MQSKDNEKDLERENKVLKDLVRQLEVKLYVAESRLKEKELYEEELKRSHEEELSRLNELFEKLLNETFHRLCPKKEVDSNGLTGSYRVIQTNGSVSPGAVATLSAEPSAVQNPEVSSSSERASLSRSGSAGNAISRNSAPPVAQALQNVASASASSQSAVPALQPPESVRQSLNGSVPSSSSDALPPSSWSPSNGPPPQNRNSLGHSAVPEQVRSVPSTAIREVIERGPVEGPDPARLSNSKALVEEQAAAIVVQEPPPTSTKETPQSAATEGSGASTAEATPQAPPPPPQPPQSELAAGAALPTAPSSEGTAAEESWIVAFDGKTSI